MFVHARTPTRVQAKAFFGLTKDKAMNMAATERASHCLALKSMDTKMISSLKDCSSELMETLSVAMDVCSSGSGTAQDTQTHDQIIAQVSAHIHALYVNVPTCALNMREHRTHG